MTPITSVREKAGGMRQRILHAYETHQDFVFLLALFGILQLMLLFFFAPGGRFGDYSDYWFYEEMASRLDGGYYPYIHYWVEYPPLFPWLPVGAYWLSRLLAPAPNPQLWFYVVFGGLMGVFAVGNLVMVYFLGLRLYERPRAFRSSLFYALLFGPIFVHAGWFDGVALFFMLLSLYWLFGNRAVLSGAAAGLGAMIKVLPLALVPVAFKVLSRRWRYLVSVALVVIVVNVPFYLANPVLFVASWRALLTQPSWETVWALLDGYYSYGLVIGNRFDPAQAGGGQRPEFVPWALLLGTFALVYFFLYILPWQRRPAERMVGKETGWIRAIWDQFRSPILGEPGQTMDRVSVVAFVGLSLNLFMLFSKGYSPQFLLWYMPFLVLALPNGWGLLYATLLTLDSVFERIFYFFVLPDSQWLLVLTVLFRTVLMLVLVPEYLAVMGFLSAPRWQRIRRWALVPASLSLLVVVGVGAGLFIRDYHQQRYLQSEQRQVVDRIRASARVEDGVVVTGRESFDAVAPFLPDQEVRFYSRVDGEFRGDAFDEQWRAFVARHPRVWLLLDYAGGQNADWNAYLVERLSGSGYKTVDEWMGSEQRLVHFAATEPADFRDEEVEAVFGERIRLQRVRLAGEALRGGEVLRLRLRWQAESPRDEEYTAFLHLVSSDGQLVAQRDVPLAFDRDSRRVGLLLPQDLEAGDYRLRIGVYDPATGTRLSLPAGEDVVVIEGVQIR